MPLWDLEPLEWKVQQHLWVLYSRKPAKILLGESSSLQRVHQLNSMEECEVRAKQKEEAALCGTLHRFYYSFFFFFWTLCGELLQ